MTFSRWTPSSRQFLVSCEHASNRIPDRYERLGLSAQQHASHIAWDPGSRTIAEICARKLRCPCFKGRYSRVLVDLNRSLHHRRLIPRVSFGVSIPGNREISAEERELRIRGYYTPYRTQVLGQIRKIVTNYGRSIHLSMHSFTPLYDGVERRGDIGLLYDPSRKGEASLVRAMAALLGVEGFQVRRNYPYRGTNDGFTTFCRRVFNDRQYAGIEIEVNQRLLADAEATRGVGRKIARALGAMLG